MKVATQDIVVGGVVNFLGAIQAGIEVFRWICVLDKNGVSIVVRLCPHSQMEAFVDLQVGEPVVFTEVCVWV